MASIPSIVYTSAMTKPAHETPGTTPTASPGNGSSPARRLIAPLLLLLALVVLGNWLGGRWPQMEAALHDMGAWAYAAYLGCFTLLIPLCFPVSVLGVSAGFLFGPWLGFAIHFASGIVAGTVVFGLGRGLLRGRIQHFLARKPRLAAVDRMVGERAVRLNLLARLSPLNYGLVCYTLASGRTDFRSYLIGLAGNAPSMAAQIWVGVVARQSGRMGAGEMESSPGQWIALGVGLVFFGLLGWQISRLVKAAWREMEAEAETTDSAAASGGEA